MSEKIVPFPGNRKESAPRREHTEVQEQYLDIKILTRMLTFLANLNRSDPRANNAKNIEVRKKVVAEYSKTELIRAVNDGNESRWKQFPSFYHALIEVLKEKGLMPQGR